MMMSQGMLTGYFWGVYGWFFLGVVVIGIPAIIEFGKLLFGKRR